MYWKCALVLVMLMTHSKADFTEYPSNISLPVGTVAVFRCSHPSNDITWIINGMPAEFFPDARTSGLVDDGSLVFVVNITAKLENNGTQVVCRANLPLGAPEVSPLAILTVIAGEEIPTTTSIPLVTTAVMTTDFIEVPSPPVVVVTREDRYVYRCRRSQAQMISWRINGRVLGVETTPQNISSGIITDPGGGTVYTLTIVGVAENNETSVQCSALVENNRFEQSPSVEFFIQGPLDRVNNLTRNGSTLSWTAPFSLNLTNVEPDIVYSVEIYNVTCGRNHLISDCNVLETEYSDGDLQEGYIYEYTVTPRSNVEGVLNDISLTIKDKFMKLQLSSMALSFSIIGHTYNALKTMLHLQMDTTTNAELNQVHATSYSLLLNALDGYKGSESLLKPTTVSPNGNSVILETFLPFRRRLNYTVIAHGCDNHPVMEATEISTHDIQSVAITSSHPGKIRMTGELINGSKTTGVLAIIVLSTSEILYHFVTRESSLHIDDTVANVVGGDHRVSIFVVEENGLPFNRTASAPEIVSVEDGNTIVEQLMSIEYSVWRTSTGVCINCTFQNSSSTYCVAVVHQRISQLNSSGLMNIESSHKFTRSGDTASGCIEGVNLENSHVGVIEGILSDTEEPPQMQCTTLACRVTVIVVLPLLLLLAVAIMTSYIVMFLIAYSRRIKQRKLTPSPESPLPKPPLTVNEYESVAPVPHAETTAENMPLFRIAPDGSLPQPSQEQSSDQGGPALSIPPPIPDKGPGFPSRPPLHGLIEADSTTVAYAEAVSMKLPTVPPPTVAENVVYHEVQGFQNSQGQHYTMISDLSPHGGKPDDLHKTESAYSEIKHDHSGGQVVIAEKTMSSEDLSLQPQMDLASSNPTSSDHAPFTLEQLLPELMPHASKWQSLGEALSLNDDRLDEIFTNNETDETCLEEMLEQYLMRSDLNHSWEEIEAALEKINKAENTTDYSSTFDEEPVQHSKEMSGTDGGSFESGMETKAIPVDTTLVVDGRHCPVIDNSGTCEETQSPLNFTVTYAHEYHENGIQWPLNKSQPVTEELSTQQKHDSYCSEESHLVSGGSTISDVLVLFKESQLWSMKQFVIERNKGPCTFGNSIMVSGKNYCRRRHPSKA